MGVIQQVERGAAGAVDRVASSSADGGRRWRPARFTRALNPWEWTFLALVVVYSFVPVFGGLLRVVELAGGPALMPANPRALADPVPVVVHILANLLFCLGGALQFLPGLRRQWPVLHRTLGGAVVAGGMLSAASGLWMTLFFAFPVGLQGLALFGTRLMVGTAMIALLAWALCAIRSRRVVQHGAAMIRAYALGQGASTQALLGMAWMAVAGTELLGPTRDAMMMAAWVINLLAAEVVIGRVLREPQSILS